MLFGLGLASIAAPKAKPFRFNPAKPKECSRFAKPTLDIQKRFSQNGSLESLVPKKLKAGQNGYLIATTNYVRDNSKVLKKFMAHKKRLGFKVYLATEDQFGLSSPGKGRHQADKARAWMQANYKKMNLLYTLIIDNPHPDEGMIPMAKFKPRKYKVPEPEAKKDYAKYLKYKDNPRTEDGKYLLYDGSDPSDYYYADLDSEWDANGNSILAEKADYNSGKINAVADVWVGRIAYYGEDHPYGAIKDVDAMLQRTMNYENESNPAVLEKRKDVFYVGGADKRWNRLTTYFTAYNGAKIESYRIATGSGFEPTAQKWHSGRITEELKKDIPYGFINFQEHGSATSMAGQINTGSAITIKRKNFGYVYLGGCDVNSPEHSDNITYALFRHVGVGAMGATRSVTGLGGDDDTEGIAGYARLFFGQSQGEAHWRMLSDLADSTGKVGASNFLMNLWGDPSLVIMPRADTSSTIVSPNMDLLKFRHQFQSAKPAGYDFVVHNSSSRSVIYKVKYSSNLIPKVTSFRLSPKSTRKIPVHFKYSSKLPVGNTNASFAVYGSDGGKVKRDLQLNVYARNALLNLKFDSLADRKVVGYDVKNDAAIQLQKELKYHNESNADFVLMPKSRRADLSRTKVVIGTSSCSIAAKFRFEGVPGQIDSRTAKKEQRKAEKNHDPEYTGDLKWKPSSNALVFYSFGKTFNNFRLLIDNGVLECTYTTLGEDDSKRGTSATVTAPIPEAGKWHSFVAIADRDAKKVRLILNGKEYSNDFNPRPTEGMQFQRMRFGFGKNKFDTAMDELSIFDYALSPAEIKNISKGELIRQIFPKNADKAHPKAVNLVWKDTSKDKKKYVIALSKSSSFKDQKLITADQTSTSLKNLEDKTVYYWRVGIKKGSKVMFPWKNFSTFETDSSLKSFELNVRDSRNPIVVTAKDNNFSIKLGKFAKVVATTPEEKKAAKKEQLIFTKISGDEWLRCPSDGVLFSNYGAPRPGKYDFEFSVSTKYGLPKTFKITVEAQWVNFVKL